MAPTLTFILSNEAVARVHDAVLCLAKFGELVSFEARRGRLTLTALNSSKSAYASFRLDKDTFFENYSYNVRQINDDGESRFTCQLYNKALLSIFKGRLLDRRDGDTAVERCEVCVQDQADKTECRLIIKMICRHGVIKTYKLTYESVEVVHALFDKNATKNKWRIGANVLRSWIEYFGAGTEHLDICSENGRVAFTSYTEKVMDDMEILKHPLQTSIAIDELDFEEFTVEEKLRIGISVKDFRAIVTHAETLKTSINAHYSYPTRPMQLTYQGPGMQCDFTLMTIGEYRGGSVTPVPGNARTGSVVASERLPSRPSSRAPSRSLSRQTSRQPSQQADEPQPLASHMPPPVEPASRSFAREAPSQRSQRPSPPPPKASVDTQSLFLPADDDEDERKWGERNFDDEEDTLGWNANANADTFSASFHSLRQDSDQGSRLEPYHAAPDDTDQRVAATQRLSDIPTIFD